MLLKTKQFGSIEIEEDKIIEFSQGLPGFPDDKKFTVITDADHEGSVYSWLQSVDDGDVSLVIIDIFKVMPDYNPLVDENEIKELGEAELSELTVYNIAVVPENVRDMTINLKAPVVINWKSKKGRQVIVDNDEYLIRQKYVDLIHGER